MNVANPSRTKIARVSVFALGLAIVLYSSYRVGQAFAEWRQPRAAAPIDPAAAIAVNPLAGALGEGGHWSFANLDWDLRSQSIPAASVESRIETLIASAPTSDAELRGMPDASPELLRFLKSAHLVPTVKDGAEIYRLDRPTLKAVVILHKIEDRAKAIGGMVAYSQNDRDWQSFEFSPQPISASRAESIHLLPLPADAIQSAARTAADGRLLLEMITMKSPAESLLNDWKQAGWEVRPAALGTNISEGAQEVITPTAPGSAGGSEASQSSPTANPRQSRGLSNLIHEHSHSGFSYLCARGNEIVYAWSADSSDSLEHLILTRSPSDAELQSQTKTPTN